MRATRALAVGSVAVSAALLVLASCASKSGRSSGSAGDVITSAELEDSNYSSLYDYFKDYPGVRIGPNPRTGEMQIYLRGGNRRFEDAPGGAILVVDGQEMGNPVSFLQDLPLTVVRSVRILTASRAAARYGTRAGHGVIEVTTKS